MQYLLVFCSLLLNLVVFLGYLWQQKQARKRMKQEFQALSLEALEKSQSHFLCIAKQVLEKQQLGAEKDLEGKKKEIEHILSPLKEQLLRLDTQHKDIERKRQGAYSSLEKQIEQLVQSEKDLRTTTANLVGALQSPNVRGSWGQVHLRRVVELAGMLDRCDFFEEVHVKNSEGQIYRPDLLVRLPGKREIVIDAKVSLEAYLQAAQEPDTTKKKKRFQEHALQVKRHVKTLQSKQYWKQFTKTPEYVILFLPAEAFFSSALESDPTLIEAAMGQNVIIATPTTLIAILKAVAFGWRQEMVAEDTKKIADLGKQLYERILVMANHWTKVGEALDKASLNYNRASNSLEKRVFVSARKLGECSSQQILQEPQMIQEKIEKLQTIQTEIHSTASTQ